MKAILLDEAKKWLEENCENQYTRMAVFGIMQSMPAVDYQETPNEPLTLEQLREMDGKAAYVPETNCWVLVTKNSFVPLFTWPDGEQCSAYDWYEQVGPVYRRPPEGEEGT